MRTQLSLFRSGSKAPETRHGAADKLRGGYYTPTAVAEWMSCLAVRSGADHVLEPSCGDGVFLEAAAKRLLALGARSAEAAAQIQGIEVVPEEAKKASRRLRQQIRVRTNGAVVADDFFSWIGESERHFDAVIGNPPFIRYQSFPEPSRSLAMDLLRSAGLTPNRLTNMWVPFVVGGAMKLAVGGRMALLVPAELLQVSYAAQLRSFLLRHFTRIDLRSCNQLFFTNAEQEVIALLCDGKRPPAQADTCRIALSEARSVSDLTIMPPKMPTGSKSTKSLDHETEKWTKYFLTSSEISFMRALRASDELVSLSRHASVDVGIVTGRNEFFVLARSDIRSNGLEDHAAALVGRSSHLKGAVLRQRDWDELANGEQRVFLFHAEKDKRSLPRLVRKYVEWGESQGFHTGFKCSIRNPWYAVPSIWQPDCFFFRQIYDFPKVVLNKAAAVSTDTVHRMRCASPAASVVVNLYTYLTAASAEIEGRSYGGGVLELEPTEADRILIPRVLRDGLGLQEIDALLRRGCLEALLRENSRILLANQLGLSPRDCRMLERIWMKLRTRRTARRRSSRAEATPRNAPGTPDYYAQDALARARGLVAMWLVTEAACRPRQRLIRRERVVV